MNIADNKTLEHPRILFFLCFFSFSIGIGSSILSNISLGIKIALLIPLFILFFGWWKQWYITLLVLFMSISGWYLWYNDHIKREIDYNILMKNTEWFSWSYTIKGKVEKILYTSNLTNTYRLHIDNIANRSTKINTIVSEKNIGIFIEVPNNLHLTPGDIIEFDGKIMKLIEFPLQWFGWYAWYHKAYGKSSVPIFQHIQYSNSSNIDKIQIWAKSIIFSGFPENISGIILGMTIGNIELLSTEVKKSFTNAGITHILVVSGSNITFVIIIITGLLRYIPLKKWIQTLIVILFVLFYGSLVGWDMPIIRAITMGIIAYIALEWWKRISSISILFFVGWIILLYSPLALIYDAWFGLSFAGTLGILLFQKSLLKKLDHWYIPKFLIEIISVTIAATIGSTVAIIYHFGVIPIFTILSNILIGGVLGWILFSSIFYLLFAIIGGWILYIWWWTIYLPTTYIMWVGEFFWGEYTYTIDPKLIDPITLFLIGLLISYIFFTQKTILQSK